MASFFASRLVSKRCACNRSTFNEQRLAAGVDAPMSSGTCGVRQVSQDQRVQLTNDVALEAAMDFLFRQLLAGVNPFTWAVRKGWKAGPSEVAPHRIGVLIGAVTGELQLLVLLCLFDHPQRFQAAGGRKLKCRSGSGKKLRACSPKKSIERASHDCAQAPSRTDVPRKTARSVLCHWRP